MSACVSAAVGARLHKTPHVSLPPSLSLPSPSWLRPWRSQEASLLQRVRGAPYAAAPALLLSSPPLLWFCMSPPPAAPMRGVECALGAGPLKRNGHEKQACKSGPVARASPGGG